MFFALWQCDTYIFPIGMTSIKKIASVSIICNISLPPVAVLSLFLTISPDVSAHTQDIRQVIKLKFQERSSLYPPIFLLD